MNFNDLTQEQKQTLHTELSTYAQIVGGTNPFLKMLEEIRDENPKALLNKTAIYHCSIAKILWGKSIFKDTLNTLYTAVRNEEKNGDIFKDLAPKEYKNTMNMVRALKPITITIQSKKEEDKEFSFMILDTSEQKQTKITLLFKIIFFYNIDFAKKTLLYKASEA